MILNLVTVAIDDEGSILLFVPGEVGFALKFLRLLLV